LKSDTKWAWEPHEARWEEGFAHLQQFVADHGRARVPYVYVTGDGYPLGQWLSNQRQARRRGQLDEVRRKRLHALLG
jgi:hypothetical protein